MINQQLIEKLEKRKKELEGKQLELQKKREDIEASILPRKSSQPPELQLPQVPTFTGL